MQLTLRPFYALKPSELGIMWDFCILYMKTLSQGGYKSLSKVQWAGGKLQS